MKKTVFAALAALVLAAGAFAADFLSYLKVSGTTITGYTDGVPASLTIPAGITKIGDHALMGCTAIKSATVPGSVTELEPGAFSGCSSLVSVTIAEKKAAADDSVKASPQSPNSPHAPTLPKDFLYTILAAHRSPKMWKRGCARPARSNRKGVAENRQNRFCRLRVILPLSPGGILFRYVCPPWNV